MVIDVTRMLAVALILLGLVLSASPAEAQGLRGPAAAAQDVWDTVRAGTFGVLDYSSGMMRSMTGWFGGAGPGIDESKAEDIRGLLNLSDKEFREVEAQVRAAGYVLQGYSFGLGRAGDVELVFEFERLITDREREELRRQLDQQAGLAGTVRRSVLLGLLDATRYVDASPAGGYRFSGVTMRLGAVLDLRVRFRRVKS
jgi:hypothetical protein